MKVNDIISVRRGINTYFILHDRVQKQYFVGSEKVKVPDERNEGGFMWDSRPVYSPNIEDARIFNHPNVKKQPTEDLLVVEVNITKVIGTANSMHGKIRFN